MDHLAAIGDDRNREDSRAGPDCGRTGGQVLDVLLGPLAAYLDALEASVAALERRLTAVPLMTAADAARYARVNVQTILARGPGQRATGGRLCRPLPPASPAMPSTAGLPRDRLRRHRLLHSPRRHRRRKGSDAVQAAWQALG